MNLTLLISVIVHKNNITQTDDHESACELFRSYSYDLKQNWSTAGLQTFDIGPFTHSHKRTTKKIRKALKIKLLDFLTLPCRVVTKGHTYLNKPAAESFGTFKCVWCFGTTWRANGLKRNKDMHQNQSQNLLKIWSFGTGFSFYRVLLNTDYDLLTRTLHEKWCFL